MRRVVSPARIVRTRRRTIVAAHDLRRASRLNASLEWRKICLIKILQWHNGVEAEAIGLDGVCNKMFACRSDGELATQICSGARAVPRLKLVDEDGCIVAVQKRVLADRFLARGERIRVASQIICTVLCRQHAEQNDAPGTCNSEGRAEAGASQIICAILCRQHAEQTTQVHLPHRGSRPKFIVGLQ